jgi:LETM1 and EF-hand domain-containing protein 1
VTETAKQDLEDAFKTGVLIPPPPDAPWAKRVFHQAKELFKFYWRGLKMVNTHRKHVNEINRRIREGGSPLTRWEQRFIRTHHSDRMKLIPFIIIALIAEEVIPLIAIYAPGMLPSTCVLPSQAERIEQQKREKQKAALELFKKDFAQLVSKSGSGALPLSLLPGDTTPFCQLLRLSSLGPEMLRQRRLKKNLEWIAKDDALLAKEESGKDLTHSELEEALLERGIVTQSTSTKEMLTKLHWWLDSIGSQGTDPISRRLFLVSSNGARLSS